MRAAIRAREAPNNIPMFIQTVAESVRCAWHIYGHKAAVGVFYIAMKVAGKILVTANHPAGVRDIGHEGGSNTRKVNIRIA